MVAAKCSPEEFETIWHEEECSPIRVARRIGVDIRNVYQRRTILQKKGVHLPTMPSNSNAGHAKWHYPAKVDLPIADGSILICSDAHFWPGKPSPMWDAFVTVAKNIKPACIILNGDMIDGAKVSRHPKAPGYLPTLAEEVEATRANLDMLPASAWRFWTVGNHDMRVDAYLASHAPELSDYAGSLRDRFEDWPMAWAVVINDDVEIRHRFRSGVHSRWNNALHGGVTMVTGHTHQLGVTPVPDRRGTRYGIECGMIADPMGAQFQYGEGMPSRWHPGFVVLTFAGGQLQPPELCQWTARGAVFRGEVVADKPRVRVRAAA